METMEAFDRPITKETQIAAAFFADLVQKNHSLEQLFDIITHMSELALAYAQMQAEVVKATESGKPANLN